MAAVTRLLLLIAFFVLSIAGSACAAPMNTGSFPDWLQGVEQEAVAEGVSPEAAHAALQDVTYDDHIIELDEKQPETTITFEQYLHRTVTPERITEGRRLLQENAEALAAVSARYNVQPEIIVALWGIESSYGQRSGDYTIIDSLATLAYAGRRADFFRKELIDALRIVDQQHIQASSLYGSWAGAMGQCQFMPSTYLHYAASYTGTDSPNIWDNTADVFASIANYISAEGWRGNEGWGYRVGVRGPIPESEIGINNSHSLAEWSRMGVEVQPDGMQTASLIAPDWPDGRYFLVYDNFRALMKWNRSTFFAASVGLLADRISDDK